MRLSFTLTGKGIIIFIVILVVLMVSLVAGSEYYTSQPEFCGTCHTMQQQYKAWQHSKHNEVSCVDCHFPPGEKFTLKAKFIGLGMLFSYLGIPDAGVRKRVTVKDQACMRSGCHSGDDDYRNKEIKLTERVSFKHKVHEEKTIEGQKLHCNTCHIKYSADKHFEVPQEMCFLCHFRETDFNQGRSKCTLCHEIPTKSLQSQTSLDNPDQEPITHQTMAEGQASCHGCHYQLVSGNGEIKKENCRNCHHEPELLAKIDKKLMHERHVATQEADCFDCHQPIQHKEQTDFLDAVRTNCQLCHPDHHRFQMRLLAGTAQGSDIPETPALMNSVKTNCLGCHIKVEQHKGQIYLIGAGEACLACHTESQADVLEDWKETLDEELKYARELEEEAQKAITAAQGKVSEEKLKEAMTILAEGRKNLHIVEYGNGVHNKKYSIMLLDAAMTIFEELVDFLQEEG